MYLKSLQVEINFSFPKQELRDQSKVLEIAFPVYLELKDTCVQYLLPNY